MAFVGSTFTYGSGGRGAFSGGLYRIALDFVSNFTKRMYLPPSASAIEAIPSVASYLQRLYMVGQHTQNLVIDEDLRVLRQGIVPPPQPTVSAGAGTTPQRCYLRWFDEITQERSSTGLGKDITGNVTRTWSQLPTEVSSEALVVEGTVNVAAGVVTGVGLATNFGVLRPGDRIAISTDLTRWAQVSVINTDALMSIDDTAMAGAGVILVVKPVSRVSHIEEWIAVNGGLPRFGTRLRIGTTGNVESIATLALGEALIDTYEPMPTGNINVVYNDRQFVAGVQGQLDTLFASEVSFPEHHAGLSFRTRYGEPIVGAIRYRDYLIVLCPDSSYRLQGYTEDDYTFTILEPDIGGLGHLGNRIAEGLAFIPGRKGVQIFNGAFHPAIPTRRTEWVTDYRSNAIAFEGGLGVVNPDDQNYIFLPNSQRVAVFSTEVPTVGAGPICDGVGIGGLRSIPLGRATLYMESDSPNFTSRCTLFYYAKEQSPRVRYHEYTEPGLELDQCVAAFGDGYLYVAGCTDSAAGSGFVYLKRMAVGTGAVPEILATIPYVSDPGFEVGGITQFDGDIYLTAATDTTAADHRIYRYTAGALTVDDATVSFKNETWLREILGELFYVRTTGFWRKRSGGVWSNSIASIAAFNQLAVYNDEFWSGAGTNPNIVSFDGVTTTVRHTNVLRNFVVFGTFEGSLYYLNIDADSSPNPNEIWLGVFNGLTFNDSIVDLKVLFPTITYDVDPAFTASAKTCFLKQVGVDLCILMKDSAAPGTCDFVIIRSNGSDVTSWTMDTAHHHPVASGTRSDHGAVA